MVEEQPLVEERLRTNWWALLVRGLLAVLFGVLTIVVPGLTLAALILLFAVYALAEGVLNIIGAIRRRGGKRHVWVLVVEGLVSILAGLVALFWPGITAIALVYVIAAWALLTGVLEISAAIRLRRKVRGEWLLALSGILSIALGVLLMLNPGVGALVMVIWIGAYAIVFGALLVFLGLRMRLGRAAPPWVPGVPTPTPTPSETEAPAH